mmetsp:Transcript_72620/g.200376  ORF Transcript_72620/g.200376 Transcript_72620/m.200376 type:complete len:205 (-) Transcript_72620:149-763(-)
MSLGLLSPRVPTQMHRCTTASNECSSQVLQGGRLPPSHAPDRRLRLAATLSRRNVGLQPLDVLHHMRLGCDLRCLFRVVRATAVLQLADLHKLFLERLQALLGFHLLHAVDFQARRGGWRLRRCLLGRGGRGLLHCGRHRWRSLGNRRPRLAPLEGSDLRQDFIFRSQLLALLGRIVAAALLQFVDLRRLLPEGTEPLLRGRLV